MTIEPTGWIIALAVLALLPFALILVTSFTKIAVVLSLLRHALGVPQVPSDRVVTALAIALSVFVMAPVAGDVWGAVRPWLDSVEESAEPWTVDEIGEVAVAASAPLRTFLERHADPDKVAELTELAGELHPTVSPAPTAQTPLNVLITAFVITELSEAFMIGFLLFLPFLVLDLLIANLLLSLGLHAVNPSNVSLPFKLLLFVVVDGWYLLIRGLLLGYAS